MWMTVNRNILMTRLRRAAITRTRLPVRSACPGPLAAPQAVLADAAVLTDTGARPGRLLLGFDRGGAFPLTFAHRRAAGVDWVSYRHGPLVAPQGPPRRSWVVRDGRRITMTLTDQTVQIVGYGPARQLTVYEHGASAAADPRPGAGLLAPGPLADRERLQVPTPVSNMTVHQGFNTSPRSCPSRNRGAAVAWRLPLVPPCRHPPSRVSTHACRSTTGQKLPPVAEVQGRILRLCA